MSTLNLDMTTQQIVAEFYIEGTTGGPAVGNIAVLNLDGNVSNVLRGDGTFGVGGGGGSANVAGANGTLQYNANGALGGVSGVTSDGNKLTVNTLANLSITGGSNGQMITTDGSGNLTFSTVPGYINIPRVEVSSPPVFTTNPSWTDPTFAYYGNDVSKMNIFVNGVLSDPDWFTLVGNTLTYQGGLLPGSPVDILAQTLAIANTNYSGNINAQNITCLTITGDGSGLTNIPGGTKISNGTTSVSTFSTGNVKITADGADMVNIDQNAMEVNGDLLPAANIVYDLGSATRRWRDLYLSNNTIYLNDTSLSADANGLSVDGSTMATQSYVGNTITSTVNKAFIDALAVSADTANVAALADVATVANSVDIANVVGIGNIATLNLDGDAANVLTGDGTFVKFGNVGALDLDGNAANVLSGNGSFVKLNAAPGNTSQVLYNNGGNIAAVANITVDATNGNLTVGSASPPILALRYSNTSSGTVLTGRARGTRSAPIALQVGDLGGSYAFHPYTGNGTGSLDGQTGWASTAVGAMSAAVTALPSGPGLPPTGEIRLSPSINTSNVANATIATSFAQTTIRGNLILHNKFADYTTTKYVPATATSTGTIGQVAWDADYIYICTATNTWKRSALTTW